MSSSPSSRPQLARQGSTLSSRNNVRVYARFRPANVGNERERESALMHGLAMDIWDNQVTLKRSEVEDGSGFGGKEDATFSFDDVFGVESTQEQVFQATCAPLIDEIFEGYNATILAYGQTGSGKTHTMTGELGTPLVGIIPRLVERIFDGIENASNDIEFTLKCSMVEIYLERIRDLLNPRQTNLHIRESANGGVYVKDVSEIYVSSFEQVLGILHRGNRSRSIGQTHMNIASSRSHSVFICTLNQTHKTTGAKKNSKLFLVDLAGSEKVAKSHAVGQRLNEAKHINKSLSALGNVINHLTEGREHIPYRDSKLTRLLNDSLGGNSKTSLIITCSPTVYNIDETLSTLRFGARAKRIKNRPKVNQERSVAEYQDLLRKANRRIRNQKEIIASLEGEVAELRSIVETLDPSIDMDAIVRDAAAKQSAAAAAARRKSADTDEFDDANTLEETGGALGGASISASSRIVAELQARVEALELQLVETDEAYQQAKEEVMEKDSELFIQNQMLDDRQEDLTSAQAELTLLSEQRALLEEKVSEYGVFRKKVELMEQEYIIQLDELEVENADLTEKLHALLLNEIESRHERRMRKSIRVASSAAGHPSAAAKAAERDQLDPKQLNKTGSSSSLLSPRERLTPRTRNKLAELEKENRRLREELRRTGKQYLTVSAALDELRAEKPVESVETALTLSKLSQDNSALNEQADRLKRQLETQTRLLKNRQAHIDVLELALEEANTTHKKLDHEKRRQIAELKEKLHMAQQMFDDLLEDGDMPGAGGAGGDGLDGHRRGSSGHMIVPLRGGKAGHTGGGSADYDMSVYKLDEES